MDHIVYEATPVHLVKAEQRSPEYLKLNPNATVPTLVIDGKVINQSTAIIELLEEMHPGLLPTDIFDRAVVRSLMALIGCDIQPMQNLRLLNYIGETQDAFANHFTLGMEALEAMLVDDGGLYSFGDQITLADAYLVPQVYNAVRWGVDMTKFPLIVAINARLVVYPAYVRADPSAQPDAQ